MHRSLGIDGGCGLLVIQVMRLWLLPHSFSILIFFFFSLFTPSLLHVLILQDLAAFLAVLAGTREADSSPRLVKHDKSIVGRGRDENSVTSLVTRCDSSLPSSPTDSSALYVLTPGFVESSCRSRIFWMKLNKLLLQGKFFQLEINGESQVAALSTIKARESPKGDHSVCDLAAAAIYTVTGN